MLGFFSANDCVNNELFNLNERKANFVVGEDMEKLVCELTNNYSHPGATILDITGMNGRVIKQFMYYNNYACSIVLQVRL